MSADHCVPSVVVMAAPPQWMLISACVGGGVPAAIVRVTAIVAGDPAAPAAFTVTVPLYVPAAMPERFGWIEIEPAPVPEAGETESQPVVVEADQFKVPLPEFAMATLCAEGFAPPTVPAKERLFEATLSDGAAAAATDRVTAIVAGDPVAPEAPTVTEPV